MELGLNKIAPKPERDKPENCKNSYRNELKRASSGGLEDSKKGVVIDGNKKNYGGMFMESEMRK